VANDMLNAIGYIHEKTYLHLDLKPSNILVTKYFDVKIADFGLSQKIQKILPYAVGTPIYMAPEIYKGTDATYAADVYSLGLVFYALFLEEEPFRDIARKNDEEFWQEKIQNQLSFPSKCPKKLKSFIEELIAPTPNERPTIARILNDNHLERFLSGEEKFRSIWETHFADRNSVHLIEFVLRFYQTFSYKPLPIRELNNDPAYKVMKAIMCKNSILISRDDVNRFVTLLTPLDGEGFAFIAKAEELLRKEYFWGALNPDDAITVLKKSKHNKSYLVRFSATDPGKFTISVTKNKGKAVEGVRTEGKSLKKKKVAELEDKDYRSRFITKELPITSYHHLFEQVSSDSPATSIPPEFSYIEVAFNDYLSNCEEPLIEELIKENPQIYF